MVNTNNEGQGGETVALKRHTRRKPKVRKGVMEIGTTVVEVHKSAPARVHTSARRNRSQSRHERHKCHKHKQRVDEELENQVSRLKNENYLLNRRLNASLSSIDSGLADGLPPFEVDLKKAYQHVKVENTQLMEDVRSCRIESEKMHSVAERLGKENAGLKEDVTMLKNLVYRLNVELEKFQSIREKLSPDNRKTNFELPKYYQKNFIKPFVPLLNAYSETIAEKNELIELLERNFDKFTGSFNELLKENETLYKELENRATNGDCSVIDDIKYLRDELNVVREDRDLVSKQLKDMEKVLDTRVSQLERERNEALETLHETNAELNRQRGKCSVFKQELDRLRCDDDSKIPLIAHSASIGECKRLLQSLKNEHESEKLLLINKVKEAHLKLVEREDEMKKDLDERLVLEQGNFDLSFECEALKRRIAELQGNGEVEDNPDEDLKLQFRDSVKKNAELENKLAKTKKRLQQSMAFAEDLVREQEGLLTQLHEKRKENLAMVSQFGSLKTQLKDVEKGAQASLDCVEDKIKAQEAENLELLSEVERLTKLLRERDSEDISS